MDVESDIPLLENGGCPSNGESAVGAVYDGVNELGTPLLIQERWLCHQEKDAKPPQRRRRVVGIDAAFQNAFFRRGSIMDPSAPLKEASRLLLDVASSPPMSGGEWHAQFIHTFFDPATDIIGIHTLPLHRWFQRALRCTLFNSRYTAKRLTRSR